MQGWVDQSKTVRSKDYRGSHSFATFLIIGPTCFFLGILFAAFPYDYPLLWTSAPVDAAYYDQLETHLRLMHAAPPLIPRLLNIIMFCGFLGFFAKLFRPTEANLLFDGASLVLFTVGAGIYIANIVKGLRAVTAGIWDQAGAGVPGVPHDGPLSGEVILGREDSMKVLAASNTILALVLVGVLVLQAGQWYAERRELDEFDKMEEEANQSRDGKKKQ